MRRGPPSGSDAAVPLARRAFAGGPDKVAADPLPKDMRCQGAPISLPR